MHLAHLELKVVDRNVLLKYIATAEDFDLLLRDERFDSQIQLSAPFSLANAANLLSLPYFSLILYSIRHLQITFAFLIYILTVSLEEQTDWEPFNVAFWLNR